MKKTLSLFLTLALGVVLTVPAFADIQYADKGGNYTVVTDETFKGGVVSQTFRDVAVVWENRSSDGQNNGYENSRAYQLVKADNTGYHSVSDWYQDMSGLSESGFVAAKDSNSKWGVLNAEGQTVLDFKFERISDLTDDGYALVKTGNDTIVWNLKTGKEVFRNSYKETGQPPDESSSAMWIRAVGAFNNGLLPVEITEADSEHSQTYGQYFGLDGKPAFPNKFNGYTSVSNFHNGYAIVSETVKSLVDDSKYSVISSVIDTKGNILLSDRGNDFSDASWRDGEDFYLSFSSIVSPEGIIGANFPKDIHVNGTSRNYSLQHKFIDLSGNPVYALADFIAQEPGYSPSSFSAVASSFHHGYAAVKGLNKESSKIFSKRLLIDTDGNPVFTFSENSGHQFYLSDVSNTGFCWLAEEGGWGKEDGYGQDRIIGVIQVPVTESPTPEPVSEPVQSGQFADVSPDAYYADAVNWAVARGVTNGVSATNFAPADTCTRGQVATFLWRANGSPEPVTTGNPFTDVDPSSAFYKAILWAAENGITAGTSESTFSPGNPCTRAHVVTFLWRAQGRPAPSGEGSLADSFPQGYYTDAVRWADAAGLLSGTGEAFTPSALCPRADIVTYLYRNLA